ncbi:1,3-beta-glucanase, partial [Streptomyces spinosirectus]
MASPRLLRRCLFAALSAVLVASAATGAAHADPAGASPAAATSAAAVAFSDTFDGPAGAAVDGSKWQTE